MAKRPLELVITRKGRKEAALQVTDDPADSDAMRSCLTGWLAGNGWDQGRWGEFEMTAFAAGTSRRLARGIRT